MKHSSVMRRITAATLCCILLFSAAFPVRAASEEDDASKVRLAKQLDGVIDKAMDALVFSLTNLLFSADNLGSVVRSRRFPTADEYAAAEHAGFYRGTDGALQGSGWSLGFASRSVIPVSWRRNAQGEADPNGMCLDKAHYFGGYFGCKTTHIYNDEQVHLAMLSAGTDRNGNGVQDLIIYAAVDNIGLSNGTVRDVRIAAQNALQTKGVTAEDILSFQIAATHAHTVVEALGMSVSTLFTTALKNHFLLRRDRAVEPELLQTICAQTADAACEAYDGMENGTLYYYETANVNTFIQENAVGLHDGQDVEWIRDKTETGAAQQEFFGCWYFAGESGQKTLLANIGLHPTGACRYSDRVSADVPYYVGQILQGAGVNFVFMQGAQAAVSLNHYYTADAVAWAKAHALTADKWAARYGASYAAERYNGYQKRNKTIESGEAEYFGVRATAYTIAHFLLDNVDLSYAVEPVVDAKMAEAVIPLDYGLVYVGAVTGVFGYNTVRDVPSETRYGVMTEIGYLALGSKVVMLSLPGEVSPALVYGSKDNWGGRSWSGATSWTGGTFPYAPIAQYARQALGEDKRILSMGIANDEVGYIVPDTDSADNFLTKTLFDLDGQNEELMSPGRPSGSALVAAFRDFFDTDAD